MKTFLFLVKYVPFLYKYVDIYVFRYLFQLCANAGHNEGFQAARNMPSRIGTGNKMWNILSNPETSIIAKIYAAISYILMFLSVFLLVVETTYWLQEYYTGEQNIDTSSIDIPLERKEELKSKEETVLLWVLIVSVV